MYDRLEITGIAQKRRADPSLVVLVDNLSKIARYKSCRIWAIKLNKGLGVIKTFHGDSAGYNMKDCLDLNGLNLPKRKLLAKNAAAIFIQAVFRGWKSRKASRFVADATSSSHGQVNAMANNGNEENFTTNDDEDTTCETEIRILDEDRKSESAAIIIQSAWKSHYFQKLYKFYKKLIKLHLHTSPTQLLKLINPRESILTDQSLSIRIRFRLCGEFTPKMVYKIYTLGHVVDLNSFSPRNYGSMPKRSGEIQRSEKNFNGEIGWYFREEFNDWRPVLDTEVLTPPPSEHKKKVRYHHLKSIRMRKLEKEKVEKQISWKQKFEKVSDVSLISWTKSLDYDSYHSNWLNLAASVSSDTL